MNILISVITRDIIHAETVAWLCDQQARYHYGVDIVKTPFSIPHQRNLQAERFMDTEIDYLFILDNDVVPKVGTIPDLIADLPPKTCRVAPPWTVNQPGNTPHPMAYNLGKDGLYYPPDISQATVGPAYFGRHVVDGAGMSGALIPRKLFLEMERPWFKWTHDKDGYVYETEDFYFWRKAAALGWKLEADLDLIADHIKARFL